MRTLNDYFLTVKLANVSSASSAYVAVPDNGEVIKILTVQEGAITSVNAAITFFTKQGGSTAMTGSAITIPYAGDAVGDVRYSHPSAVNTVLEGDFLKVTTDGLSTGTCPLTVTFVIRR
tara:strand:- start:7 stop:363 length:357 start_codon:yes stop_codon:yes gene_type:complete